MSIKIKTRKFQKSRSAKNEFQNALGHNMLSVEFRTGGLLFRSRALTRVGGIVQSEPYGHGSRISYQRTHQVSIQHKNQVGLHSQPPKGGLMGG